MISNKEASDGIFPPPKKCYHHTGMGMGVETFYRGRMLSTLRFAL